MSYNDILELYLGLLNLIGTIVAIITVLRISYTSLRNSETFLSVAHPAINTIVVRQYAIDGIGIICVSYILSIISKIACLNLTGLIFTIVGSIFIIFLIVGFSNRLFLETIIWYDEQLVKDGQKSIIEQFKGKENYKNRKKILKIITDTYNK